MDQQPANQGTLDRERYIQSGIRKWIVKSTLGTLGMTVILMLSAGRWDWVMGWVYVGMSVVGTSLLTLYLLRVNPEVLALRGHGGIKKDAKIWDKIMSPFLAVGVSVGVWVLGGLDDRFGWSPPMPIVLTALGVIVWSLALAVVTWAMAVNRFFEALVRIQTERGHTVVSDGPYRFVRHPGYAAMLGLAFSMPLILETWWGLILSGEAVATLILRTYLEDQTLSAELEGYEEYAQRVKFRLVPGVW